MTVATAMLIPSNFLQNYYWLIIEAERGSQVNCPPDDRKNLYAVRITSIAHAVLQFAYAVAAAVPILLVTTITVLTNANNTGFTTQNGGRLQRLGYAAGVALASLFTPGAVSLAIACDPEQLDAPKTTINALAHLANSAQAALFCFTLPSLPKLAERLSMPQRTSLNAGLRLHNIGNEEAEEIPQDRLLEYTERTAFKWRMALLEEIEDHMGNVPVDFNELFDTSSEAFSQRLQTSIISAMDQATT
jgi:hypothetical protein